MAFAGVALLVVIIGSAIVIPGRWHKPDADSILMSAAHAMAEAESVHVSFRADEYTGDTPSGYRMMPGRGEAWLSERASYWRQLAPDGSLEIAAAVNVDANEFWYYGGDGRPRYVADLAPLGSRAVEIVAKQPEMFCSDQIIQVLGVGPAHENAEKTVEIEERDGREVAVVTVTYTLREKSPHVTGRFVLEMDAKTKRLLSMHQYAQADGAPEELISAVDKIEYNVAAPHELVAFEGLPAGTTTEEATATIRERGDLLVLELVVKAGDNEISVWGLRATRD